MPSDFEQFGLLAKTSQNPKDTRLLQSILPSLDQVINCSENGVRTSTMRLDSLCRVAMPNCAAGAATADASNAFSGGLGLSFCFRNFSAARSVP